MINPHAIVARALDGFQAEPKAPPTRRESADGARAVGILHTTDRPQRGVDSWATVQASDFPTPYTLPDGRALRVEFVTAVDARLDDFGNAVAACAFAIDPANDVRPGTVYRGAVAGVYPEASTPHLFSVSPFLWDADFEEYDDDDVRVTWLQLVPITDDEAAFVAEHGGAALEEAFMNAQPDVFSIERRTVRFPRAG